MTKPAAFFCFSQHKRFFYKGGARLPQVATFWYYQFFFCQRNPIFCLFLYPLQGRTGGTSNKEQWSSGNEQSNQKPASL